MPKIFISYRRNDSADATGRLHDRLKQHFGQESLFFDIDNIPIGYDFHKYIGNAVSQCDVLLAIIGDRWLIATENGSRRLDDPNDLVRIEIEAALSRDIPVVPVLVSQAPMPKDDDLPGDLKALTRRNAVIVRSGSDFEGQISRLIKGLEHLFADQPTQSISVVNQSFEGTNAGDRRELVSGIYFRWCPAGTFVMGSPASESGRRNEEDQVSVTLSSGFWLGETEVTQSQWQKLMGTTPWKGQEWVKEGDNYAASYISHHGAVEYCTKLTTQKRASGNLSVGWKYSLPTEAQWEYACRAGTATKYSFGADESKLSEYAWFAINAGDVGNTFAHQVGSKRPNAWGLHDMHGNLWEWCSDWCEKRLGGRDPIGPSSGMYRVSRGGGWNNNARFCRSADHDGFLPDSQIYNIGFRLAAVSE